MFFCCERVGEVKEVLSYVQQGLLDLVLHQHELFFQDSYSCFGVVCQIDLSVPIAVVAGPRCERP